MTPSGKAWRGLIASLILSGAGQFFSGAKRRGLIWWAVLFAGPLVSLMAINLPIVPAKTWPLIICAWFIPWVVMLFDSWRPIISLPWWSWILLLVISLSMSQLLSSIAHILFHASRVPTANMEPTIMAGDEILIARCAYWFHEPSRGDLIVFGTKSIPKIPQDKSGKEIMYTKRLVGLPGDRVEIREGSVWINNTKMEFGDPNHPIEYRSGPLQYAFWLREREYFALGDNSRNSFDSRYWGALPRQAIYGKVTKIYWPWNRISTPR